MACAIGFAGFAAAAGDDQAIVAAAKKYVAANSEIAEVDVKVEKVVGDYARVTVIPKAGQTDPALVFLKRENGAWRGLTIGTAFTPEDYKELHIPAAVRP